MRFHCPHCGAPVNRWRLFFSKGDFTCPHCAGEMTYATPTEKIRVLPYILVAAFAMEFMRDQLHPLVRLAIILGPPALLLPVLLRLRKSGERR